MDRNRLFLVISFSIIFGWIMSFPYEGPVMYALAGDNGIDGVALNILTVFMHFLGLFAGRFISKDILASKRNILVCIGASIPLSLVIPFVSTSVWTFIIPVVSCLTGISITSFGQFLKVYVLPGLRTRTVADILIYGNIVLILAHICANNITHMSSFVLIEILLIIGFVCVMKINTGDIDHSEIKNKIEDKISLKKYWILFLFIFVITINSGIMFQVIYPYFGEFVLLTSIYTNVPYISAIFLLTRVIKINKFKYLYIGLALWGVTFIIFAFTGQTALSFVILCTFMLFACGIFDIFWWSVMASNFDSVHNPSSLLGLGLSINVLGVWVGGLIGNFLMSIGVDKQELSLMGILVVLISLLIILPLNNRLSNFIEYSEFLVKLHFMNGKKIKTFNEEVQETLSKREFEVYNLLIMGKSDNQISEELCITKNTIKTHNRNIYKKLKVANRIELIEKISEIS